MKMMKMVVLIAGCMTWLVIGGCRSPSNPDPKKSTRATRGVQGSTGDGDGAKITVTSKLVDTKIEIAVDGDDAAKCSTAGEETCCEVADGTTVRFDWGPPDSFLYVRNEAGRVEYEPLLSTPGPVTRDLPYQVDFAVVAADSTKLYWHDPKIVVQTGTCGGDGDEDGDEGN